MEILDKKNIWTEIESSVFELDTRYDKQKTGLVKRKRSQ